MDDLIRIGTLNLMSGHALAGGPAHPELIADAVSRLDVDVLAIQEVDRGQPRSGSLDQAELVARALDAAWYRHVDTVAGVPGPQGWRPSLPDQAATGTAHTPGYGVALVSRLPVERSHLLRLRPSRHRYPVVVPGRGRARLLRLPDEPRAAVAARIVEPGVVVACTHLSVLPVTGARQLRTVARWLAALPGPRVLLGDLNMGRVLARRVTGWTPLVTGPTFPSPRPVVQLDHVLASGLPVGSRFRGHTVRLPISDHQAAVVELRLGPGGSS